MTLLDFLTLIGGLAFFLFGMETLGLGLKKITGGQFEKILSKITNNPFQAVLLGILVTAIIQSSSATTVMTVGLVNSGIISLSQAVSVIMGANIGTTVTSWILSLAGLESDNLIIAMLKPDHFSPIIAMIGVILIFFKKEERKKSIGNILIGFAILMYGMQFMSASVSSLKDIPEFQKLFLMFENPILGMIVGAILTAIIQSSSASVGILQALCMTGHVSYASAIPIIMGQNIGTCITAIISAINVSTNGKRTACIHLYFNLIGTFLFLIIFYPLNFFLHFEFMNSLATPFGIAVVHSIFNIFATLILFPFRKVLLELVILTIKEKPEDREREEERTKFEKHTLILDDIFLERPDFALEQCDKVINSMGHLTEKCVLRSMQIVKDYSIENFQKIENMEKDTDSYDDLLSSYLMKISTRSLSAKNKEYINILFHIISHLERMTDHAYNVAKSSKEFYEKKFKLSKSAQDEMDVYFKALEDIVNVTFKCLNTKSSDLSKEILPLEEIIDQLTEDLKNRHILRLMTHDCRLDASFIWSDWLTDFERIADQCNNIAMDVMEIGRDDIKIHMHRYLDNLKEMKNEEYAKKVNALKKQYVLPEIQQPVIDKLSLE